MGFQHRGQMQKTRNSFLACHYRFKCCQWRNALLFAFIHLYTVVDIIERTLAESKYDDAFEIMLRFDDNIIHSRIE